MEIHVQIEQTSQPYWPAEESSKNYGNFSVTLLDQQLNDKLIIRKMKILEGQSKMSITTLSQTVTQFQYLDWAEENVPDNSYVVLEIANLIQKIQMSTGNKPIVVMCK